MQVVIKNPGTNPIIQDIPNELKALQDLVGGPIEVVHLVRENNKHILAIVNENGKIYGLEPNISIGYDVLVGPVILCGESADGEDFADLDSTTLFPAWEIALRGTTR